MMPTLPRFRNRRFCPRPIHVRGFSLLEALISILVLSVGLLGTAALQGVSLRATSSAGFRSQAAWLAAQMLDEARARRADVISLNPSVYDPALASETCGSLQATPISAWRARVGCALPAGQGSVNYNQINRLVTITILWNDSRGVDNATTGGSSTATFVLQSVI